MFLSPRAALRGTSAIARRTPSATFAGRRFLSTAPPTQRSRRWKSSLARWSLAGAVVYYYNTSNVFAESNFYAPNVATHTADETEQLPTVEELSAQRQQRKQAAAAEAAAATAREATRAEAAAAPQVDGQQPAGSPEALEEEAEGQGAFNPETGEINWDCPCLGGMAHGPCGDEFKAAFSCFVYSTEEPKGADCIEKFKWVFPTNLTMFWSGGEAERWRQRVDHGS
ncbi:hypothetical protein BDY21DRAFT_59113 [Lineolata rhizophorae]|uniref:Mitochondrial intermembrane space import and assembly protein 40 n=1 Tax=Lineolata rhizophorae TaxID=578093 RepID=A0A6A6NYB5_9PEZI|nr:hypothetical protein BDY21DRAFT_59113 [Lineolata rhizophorae]